MSSTTSQTDFDVPSPSYLLANLKLFESLPPNSLSSSSLRSSSSPSSSSPEEEKEQVEEELINKMNSIDRYGKKVLKLSPNITKLNKTDEDLLMMIVSEEYKMPIFVLSLFSVHYIGWMKGGNNKYLSDFMQRFSHIYERILLLPEFDHDDDDNEKNLLGLTSGELNDTVIDLATELSRNYRRQLVLTFHNINGLIKTNKKIRVTLIQEKVDDEVGEKNEEKVEKESDDDDSFNVNALSSSSSSSSELDNEQVDAVVDDSISSQNGQKNLKEEESKVNVNNIILGEVNLVEDVQYALDIPEATNSTESTQIYFKLSLMDSDDPTNREYIRIKISEALISGYTGLRRKFDITLNEDFGEQVMECFEFELTANWRIDPKSYREMVKEPVELLEKLSGVIFGLGEYYWYFCAGFYKWALFDSNDSIVRYTAIQIFHELCLMLSPTLLRDQMTNIYRSMYPLGGYPQLRTLHPLTESSYLLESFSILDNVMHVFVYLSPHEQIEVVRRLLSQATRLLANRFRFIARLVGLIRASIANYPTKDAAEVIHPFVASLFNHLAVIAKPEYELADPRPDRPITWKMVNGLGGNLCNLLVECIKCARPKQFKLLSIDDYKMTGVRVLLNLTIQALFNQKGISFLKAIFIRLYARKVLNEDNFIHFVTSDRVKQYREWMK